jgi:hypothetical protein
MEISVLTGKPAPKNLLADLARLELFHVTNQQKDNNERC